MTTRDDDTGAWEAWLGAGVVLAILATVGLTASRGLAWAAATAQRLTGGFDASVASTCLAALGLIVKLAAALR